MTAQSPAPGPLWLRVFRFRPQGRTALFQTALSRTVLFVGALALLGLRPAQAQGAGPAAFQFGYTSSSEQRAPLLVTFRATLPAGQRVTWDFGDGETASGPQVQHTFYRPGSFTVQARLLDAQGRLLSQAEAQLNVRPGGPEGGALTLLLGRGQVQLSAVDTVAYSPTQPRLLLDGQEVGSRPVTVGSGPHQAVTSLTLQDGRVQERRVSFTVAPLGASAPFESEVLRLTNRARARGWNCATLKEGGPARPPLTQSAVLDTAALAQSAGMALAGYFDHVSTLDGSTPLRRVQAAGLTPRTVAENIAAGHETPEEVVDGWLRSPGHCHNIMGDFSLIGLAYVHRPGTTYVRYWTQVFARP